MTAIPEVSNKYVFAVPSSSEATTLRRVKVSSS